MVVSEVEDKPSQTTEWKTFESAIRHVRPVYFSDLVLPSFSEQSLAQETETSDSDFEFLSVEGDVPSEREVVLELDLVEFVRLRVESLPPEVESFLRTNSEVIGPLSTILDIVPEYLESKGLVGLVELELNVDVEIPNWVVLNVVVLLSDIDDYGRILDIWRDLGRVVSEKLGKGLVEEAGRGDKEKKAGKLAVVVRNF